MNIFNPFSWFKQPEQLDPLTQPAEFDKQVQRIERSIEEHMEMECWNNAWPHHEPTEPAVFHHHEN